MEEQKIYRQYLDILKAKLVRKYDQLGLRASGKFERELEPEVKGNILRMWGADHSKYMEHGRDAGGMPPIKAISDWIENKKGLPQEFIENKDQIKWAIAKKIAKEGIRVPNEHNKGNVVSEPLEQWLANELYQMLDKVGLVWEKRIASDVIQILNTA